MNTLATTRIIGTWGVAGMATALALFGLLIAPNIVHDPASVIRDLSDPRGSQPLIAVVVYVGLPLGLFKGILAARQHNRRASS